MMMPSNLEIRLECRFSLPCKKKKFRLSTGSGFPEQVRSYLSKLQAEMCVSLSNGDETVAQGCPELHVQLIALKSKIYEYNNKS